MLEKDIHSFVYINIFEWGWGIKEYDEPLPECNKKNQTYIDSIICDSNQIVRKNFFEACLRDPITGVCN